MIIPGGRSAEFLRLDETVQRIVREMFVANKPVCAIGYGIQMLTPLSEIVNRKMTGFINFKFILNNN